MFYICPNKKNMLVNSNVLAEVFLASTQLMISTGFIFWNFSFLSKHAKPQVMKRVLN